MKNTIALLLLFCAAFTACGQRDPGSLPAPEIKGKTIKLTGKLTGSLPADLADKPVVSLEISGVVTGEEASYETRADDNYDFNFEVPADRNILLAGLNAGGARFMILLSADRKNHIDINFDSDGQANAVAQGFNYFTDKDMSYISEVVQNVLQQPWKGNFDPKNLDELVTMTSDEIDYRLQTIDSDSLLSDNAKTAITGNFKMLFLYYAFLESNSKSATNFLTSIAEEESTEPVSIDRSFYKLLRNFNLNDPRYLIMGYYFTKVLQEIPRIERLAIPEIGDTPVEEWLAGVKAALTDLVGFGEGQFYDLLASNAYGRQMETETRPLSEKQIANIREYFSGRKSAFAQILLRKNAEIQKLAAGVGELTLRDASGVPNEKLLETILAPHKGKTVVVDLWATWCGPCVAAMKDMRKMKAESDHDGIAFVYLTGSSDRKLWDDMIKGIGGDHYFLNEEQWEYMMDSYGFEGIPSYVVFDPDGNVRAKQEGYPGIETLWRMITGPETR